MIKVSDRDDHINTAGLTISKTPFRVSLFGGGSDYPQHFKTNGGVVLAGSISKYCYITFREMTQHFGAKYRVRYSQIEDRAFLEEIQNPAVRETLRKYSIDGPIEITHSSDIPSNSGMGSSSAFIVGLAAAITKSRSLESTKEQIAHIAIEIEQEFIRENVGYQDAITTAMGGMNLIKFNKNGQDFSVNPISVGEEFLQDIASNLLLMRVPIVRIASDIAKYQLDQISNHVSDLNCLAEMAVSIASELTNESLSLQYLGNLLDESWKIKKNQSELVSNHQIDEIYDAAKIAGAFGGKLCGAGGGGFLILVIPKERQREFRNQFSHLATTTFSWDFEGTVVKRFNDL